MNHDLQDPEGCSTREALAIISKLLLIAFIVIAVMCATGCTLTIDENGAKSFSLDGPQAIRAIEILNQK